MSSKSNSSVPSRHHQRKEPETNVHMNTLGSDGDDFSDIALDGRVSRGAAASNQEKSAVKQQARISSSSSNEDVPSSSGFRKRGNRVLPSSNPTSPTGAYRPPANSSKDSPLGLEMPIHGASSPARTNVADRSGQSSNNSSSWWGKMWGVSTADSEEDHEYRSFGSPHEGLDGENDESSLQHPRPVASLKPSATTSATNAPSQADKGKNPTVEDQLRQNCTFFFDEEAHGSGTTNRRAAIARRINPRRRLRPMHAVSTPLFSTRDGAAFHAKYEQLNQVLARKSHASGVDMLDNDLMLSIDDEQPHSQRQRTGEDGTISFHSTISHNVTDVKHSSLCYEQHGKLLMRLPRDQVRLLTDADLQPGIVAVEQWRKEGDNHDRPATASFTNPYLMDEPENEQQEQQRDIESADSKPMGGKKTTSDPNLEASFFETTPPLRYVLTVPDDLYRRVVSEMNDSLTSPCFGMGHCRHENEHADIRIAISILSVTLVLLFIGTMEWKIE